MEHFAVIQSLCRVGLATQDDKFRKQVERLLERLKKAGDAESAESLDRLLEAQQQSLALQPSKVELSRAAVGERLTNSVNPPHDRESSSPLAQIIMDPGSETPPPVLTPDLQSALDSLLQEWVDYDELRTLGVAPTQSCLIFGEPGTGKTVTAMYIATRLGLPVVLARLDGMMSSFLGTTARNIGALFEFANRYRCVLLLDEFDALAKLRDDPQEVGEIKRVVNTLLQCLDTRADLGLTIAITNHPNLLDPAIWRRFEVKIEMPLPPPDERERLIAGFLRPLSVQDSGVDLLSWASEGATGAEVRSMVNAIKRYSVLQKTGEQRGKLDPQDILAALQRYYITSAKLEDRSRLGTLRDDPKSLARALLTSEDGKFTQSTVAHLLGRDQGTISRWMREEPA
ncbi:AAA family ATPase [Oleomonas cavernae]|uniref:AAA family ATPase n=2 Tax=Oleomonas cavernae TaxID=2320859 RepID=A0A418WIY6_9PROT|nr:AAA family ATPase [Oleomonas cavernae]